MLLMSPSLLMASQPSVREISSPFPMGTVTEKSLGSDFTRVR